VLAVDGRDDLGGLDVDAALLARLQRVYADRDPAALARLAQPESVEDRRAKRQLWDDVRVAKERLSRTQRADLVIPLLDLEVHLTREELEAEAQPILEQTVRVTQGVMRWAQMAQGSMAGVFLVGGSSRIPLMATLLHRALGQAPVVIEQPELVVAEGAVLAQTALLASAPAAPGPTTMLPKVVSPAPPASVSPAAPASVSPAPAAVSPASAAPAPARSVGRVAVPGARPPGRVAGTAPVTPTRQMPPVQQPPPRRAAPPPPPRPLSPPAARWQPPQPPATAIDDLMDSGAYRAPTPRRPGRGGRAFRRLFVLVFLLVVPLVSAYVAYRMAQGRSIWDLPQFVDNLLQ
jgi:molecular chaperone DnaK